MKKRFLAIIAAALIAITAASCSTQNTETDSSKTTAKATEAQNAEITQIENTVTDGALKSDDIFTERDLTQNADLTDAQYYTVKSGEDIKITSAGVYVISGSAENTTIIVDADDADKVQIVLDSVEITNSNSPAIYVKSADKVFVTTTKGSTNTLKVTDSFTSDGDVNIDAVIFSKDDLVINGLGTLNINSTDNGITSKDDLKITGGTLNITSAADALEANDSIAVADGTITIESQKDGLHAENDDDDTVGYVYICGGTFNIDADSDGIQGTTIVQIDDGEINISASEGIEGTHVQINGGTIKIAADDDGINGSNKSSATSVKIEINGGDITIDMAQGDTDGVDSNGDLYINGGTISVNAQSPFDYDGTAEKNGGTIIVNGTETDTITNQTFGGMDGGMGGGMHGDIGVMNGGMNR